jgi:transcription elongation factor Elf1
MVLARIAPHTAGYDMRTFECPACDHSESSVVHFGGVGSNIWEAIVMLAP